LGNNNIKGIDMKITKYDNIISPTGCIHREDSVEKGRTLCNHNNYHLSYGAGFYHDWPHTDKPVTCIRCLNNLTEHLPINISITKDKEVVITIQNDVENIALWTDQDNYKIYFKPIVISPTVELVYDRKKNRWIFTCRKL